VPMIIVAPGIAPSTVSDRVRTIDLAPTLAGIMGMGTPDAVDGLDRSTTLGRREVGGDGS